MKKFELKLIKLEVESKICSSIAFVLQL